MKDEMMIDNHATHHLSTPSFEEQLSTTVPESPSAAEAPTAPAMPVDLHAVMDVPVQLRAVLGRARMDLNRLLRLKAGEVVELDRRAGEPVDIFVNNRFIARGEVVLIDNDLGVTLTEIVRQDR